MLPTATSKYDIPSARPQRVSHDPYMVSGLLCHGVQIDCWWYRTLVRTDSHTDSLPAARL